VLLFGLTGGIASGKSTVAKRIRELGIPVIDADAVAREVVLPGTEGYRAVVEAFGEGIVAADGQIDRKALGSLAFADPSARGRLNAIVHPAIGLRTAELASKLASEGHAIACYEAALLVENGLAEAFRPLVVVGATLPTQIDRVRRRDGLSQADALRRVEAQLPLAEKIAMADFVIENEGSEEELLRRTDGVVAAIRTFSRTA
jgi:dephospho-CoA kinase